MGGVNFLKSMGYLNESTEDLGVIASSKKRAEYKYYCSSMACCRFVIKTKQVENKKKGTTETVNEYGHRARTLKATTADWLTKCPDCDMPLYSEKVKSK